MSNSRTLQSFNTLCVPADKPKMFKTVCSQRPQRSCGQKCTGFTELGDTVDQDRSDKCDKMVQIEIVEKRFADSFCSEYKSDSGKPWKPRGRCRRFNGGCMLRLTGVFVALGICVFYCFSSFRFFLILFPMTFLGFNGVYWYTYLNAS
jgi:hypothetical protein